ncbi:two pore domain potassium channel family protein [bacterium]|nr:two pore domain potassium channel family protein [bacterium]
MLSLLLTLRQFVHAIQFAARDPEFRTLAALTATLLALGTLFYRMIEGWSWLDSLYFCVITLATVGYGDFSPQTAAGKIFTMIYIFLGIGLLVAVFTRLADALLQSRRES